MKVIINSIGFFVLGLFLITSLVFIAILSYFYFDLSQLTKPKLPFESTNDSIFSEPRPQLSFDGRTRFLTLPYRFALVCPWDADYPKRSSQEQLEAACIRPNYDRDGRAEVVLLSPVQVDLIRHERVLFERVHYGIAPDFITDFTSVPPYGQALIQVFGQHANAAVVHDWLYALSGTEEDRRKADALFYLMLLESGVHPLKALAVYASVRIGGGDAFFAERDWYTNFYNPVLDSFFQRLDKKVFEDEGELSIQNRFPGVDESQIPKFEYNYFYPVECRDNREYERAKARRFLSHVFHADEISSNAIVESDDELFTNDHEYYRSIEEYLKENFVGSPVSGSYVFKRLDQVDTGRCQRIMGTALRELVWSIDRSRAYEFMRKLQQRELLSIGFELPENSSDLSSEQIDQIKKELQIEPWVDTLNERIVAAIEINTRGRHDEQAFLKKSVDLEIEWRALAIEGQYSFPNDTPF